MAEQPPASLETVPTSRQHRPHGTMPNTPLMASAISLFLGATLATGAIACFPYPRPWWLTPQLGGYMISWSIFHWAEFAVTAGWNREKCSVDSFLLNNGIKYHLANALGISEYLLILCLRPNLKHWPFMSSIGVILILVGQFLRSMAMIQASTNFSHAVQLQKAQNHQLITSGVYSWLRHPSYAGFFYWGLGTQMLLQNPLSFVVFTVTLWRFFNHRIQGEEKALIRFFGDDYKRYRKEVGTKIPFI